MRDPLRWLTPAQRRAWSIIIRYARETGRRCFTYTTLFRAWREYSDVRIRPQTLDRRVRELAELGLLERFRGNGGRTVFCVRRDLYERFAGRAP